jgi:transcriptional regulator with XRE-family HTH domain
MLGKKIYELRKELNISQEEFAMAINTSRQSVSKWELGDSYPEVNKLKDIASFFNVSIDYLLEYDVENTSCMEFIDKLKTGINNKDFSITVNEIKSWVLKFNNNFDLFLWSSDYLLSFELERNERNLLELIVSY